jgi:hypoxanthine phosphoribosyltransferase
MAILDFPIKKIVFDQAAIQQRVAQIAEQINLDYDGKDLVMIGMLKGSLYFLSDLTRQLNIPVQLDFISIGTYAHTTNQTGIVRITKDLDLEVTGRHVLVIEDIIRTGLTTGYIVQNLTARMPASVKVCTLLINPQQQLINVPVAYSGFEISETRLIGYGMDIREQGRHLPYIAEIDRNEFSRKL